MIDKALIQRLKRKAKRLLKTNEKYLKSQEGKKLLKEVLSAGCSWPEMEKIFGRSKSTIEKLCSFHEISMRELRPRESDYSEAQLEIVKEYYKKSHVVHSREESHALGQAMWQAVNTQRKKEGKDPVTRNALHCAVADILGDLKWGWPREGVKKETVATKDEMPVFPLRKWPDPNVVQIPAEAWKRPGSRVLFISNGPYRKEGWRAGLFDLVATIAITEGVHFPVFAGGLVDHTWLYTIAKQFAAGKRKFLEQSTEHAVNEAVDALFSTLPRFKKPNCEIVRWYVMASAPFDGPHGDVILQRLQKRTSGQIRHYKTGGERIEVQRPSPQKSLWYGIVLPKHKRLPSRYFSQFAEREIEDVEEQTSRDFPDLWVVGMASSALYKPSGEREIPYITLPAIHKLEAKDKRIAENQIGAAIVEEMPNGDRLVHFWNFRDLIANERNFITGIKDGATAFHQKIVDIIKREGARHPGRLADELGVDQKELTEKIQFLIEPKRSPRLTWPGLRYDEGSERYDFHFDWIQEQLRYALPKDKEGWNEDSFLFFGCMHAGYTTTDYEFLVKKFPEKILEYDIQNLVGIGDFIAGLKHGMMHKGDVLNLNYTEQEQFAGEIVSTILYRVFTTRMDQMLGILKKTPTAEEVAVFVKAALMRFFIKKGNHDRWPELEGNTALVKFYDTVISLLTEHISKFLGEKGLVCVNVSAIVKEKIILVSEHKPIYTLPSGITMGLTHPWMARAETTSLRAEKALKRFSRKWGCQVVGVANFHTAIMLHKWSPKIGQGVAVQTGCELLGTDFEDNKLKDVDFGPNMLKTLSYRGRIFKTTLAAFNQPILKEPIPKWTDVLELKRKLGLLGYTEEKK